MFSIATTAGGTCNAFIDVCKFPTPAGPVPMPLVNSAMLMQANKATCSKKVKIQSQAVFTKMSMIPTSTGDEAGSLGGVVSNMIKGPAMAKTASLKVRVEGGDAVYQLCIIGQNGMSPNTIGIHDTPSQPLVKVMF